MTKYFTGTFIYNKINNNKTAIWLIIIYVPFYMRMFMLKYNNFYNNKS